MNFAFRNNFATSFRKLPVFGSPNIGKSFCNLGEEELTKTRVTEDGIWTVELSRPKLHNAFNEHLISHLEKTFKKISQDPLSRAVILTGSGSSFSAGADLNWMKKMGTYSKEENKKDSLKLFDMFASIKNCSVPVIGRIQGPALGGGSGLVASCDFAFATSSAQFGFTEVKLGLIPAVISPFVIEKIGIGNASRYFLTGERFPSVIAKQIGLIQEVFDSEKELDEQIEKIIKEIRSSGPIAVRESKELIKAVSKMDLNQESTKNFVTNLIAKLRVSEEGQQGLSAFLSKSKPVWSSSPIKK